MNQQYFCPRLCVRGVPTLELGVRGVTGVLIAQPRIGADDLRITPLDAP